MSEPITDDRWQKLERIVHELRESGKQREQSGSNHRQRDMAFGYVTAMDNVVEAMSELADLFPPERGQA